MTEKKQKLGLLPRVVLAIMFGVLLGSVLPLGIVRVFATFNSIFGNFLQFLIPLIIIGLVAPAIADIGRSAGRLLVITVLIAYLDSIFAGFFSYFTSSSIFPGLISGAGSFTASAIAAPEAYFTINIPPMVDVVTALVFSFTLGLGIAYLSTPRLKEIFSEFRMVIAATIEKAIIPLLPVYIFGIFLCMTHSGDAFRILQVFATIIGIIFAMHIVWIIMQFCIAGALTRKNPLRLLWNMLPAYATALGTASSAATIPVTLKQTLKNGVSEPIASFTVPLCATIHMPGSILKITSCAVALMLMQGMTYDFGMFAAFVMMLGVMAIAAPGVPGGSIMAALGILASILGFSEADQALMIALYIAMDSFGTAGNVTGDGAIALIMDRINGNKGLL